MCVVVCCTTFISNILILRRIQRGIIINLNCPLLLSDFNETFIFSADFLKDPQISKLMEIRLEGSELLHADRHDEANSSFSQFCERVYKGKCCWFDVLFTMVSVVEITVQRIIIFHHSVCLLCHAPPLYCAFALLETC
jgi:hypothetical protein